MTPQTKPLTEKQKKAKQAAMLREAQRTPYQRWFNDDAAYIATDEERKVFRLLKSEEERARFVEQFWLRRDPTPNTVRNEAEEELDGYSTPTNISARDLSAE